MRQSPTRVEWASDAWQRIIVLSGHVPAGPPTDEKRKHVGLGRLGAVVGLLKAGAGWCCEPVPEFSLGAGKHPRLLPRARKADSRWTNAPLGPHHLARGGQAMDVAYERCCGLDVHQRLVAACLLVSEPGGAVQKTIRTFGTMTADLLEPADFLAQAGRSHVAMESVGVYWKPLSKLLEDQFTLLVNVQHLKVVPGRKTDVKNCEWIAELLRHGLLHPSVVPDRAARELRELTRYRASLVRERTTGVNRLPKTLEGSKIELASVVSDVTARLLALLVEGDADRAKMAALVGGRLRNKVLALERALAGRFGLHQRFLVARHLRHIDEVEQLIAEVSAEIAERRCPFEAELGLLDTIPGVGRWTAEVILAEIGSDLQRVPTAAHPSNWAGMCPGNHQSAGKRKSGKTRESSPWLRVALTEAASAAGRGDTDLAAQYHRLIPRRGKKKTPVAVGHSILIIGYHVLKLRVPLHDLDSDYFHRPNRSAQERRLIRALETLGNRVTVEPIAA